MAWSTRDGTAPAGTVAALFAPDGIRETPGIIRAEGREAIARCMDAVGASGIRNSAALD